MDNAMEPHIEDKSPPESMRNRCPLCQAVQKDVTRHLTTVHKRTQEEADALIKAYCS